MEQPDAESVRHSVDVDGEAVPDVVVPHVDPVLPAWQNKCAICRRELARGERKVHKGHCARVRKSQLQRLARWRRRR
jgi:hypothetical protein